MKRRSFLKTAAALPAFAAAGRLFAAPTAGPRFLLVFLRGGYDCANVLVPYASDFYYESRPNIAIARPDANVKDGALALDANWALAPALRGPIERLYLAKQAAFVPFAGTDDLSRSHFETQDSIERGEPADKRNYGSGFMARLAATLGARAAPIAFTDALPLTFRGAGDVPNISLRAVGKPAFDERQDAILASMYQDHHLHAAVADGLELRQQVAHEFEDAAQQAASRGAINARGFAVEATRIARLMRDEYRLGFVDVGGWDTHVNEGGARGQLAGNLDNLSRGLDAFASALGPEWNNTVVVVLSEFGRTFRENGNRGTDHGHGSVYWVLGGGIAGGRIAGQQVRVQASTLVQNRDYPVLNDYRAVLGGLFARLWGLDRDRIGQVFPRSAPADLRLV
ncbi:MAG TPA: DUF1501 domain-containing protein [Rudaea sp.]|nr:DUF1501 domain-containing protein [Rudaea sp.]